jgi:hypothetical protein
MSGQAIHRALLGASQAVIEEFENAVITGALQERHGARHAPKVEGARQR